MNITPPIAALVISIILSGCGVSRLSEKNWVPQTEDRNYNFYTCYQEHPAQIHNSSEKQMLASCMTSKGYRLRSIKSGEILFSTITIPISFLAFIVGESPTDWYDENSNYSGSVAPILNNQYMPLPNSHWSKINNEYSPTLGWHPAAVIIQQAPLTSTQFPLTEKSLNLEGYKTQCNNLGFKAGTQDFGNCVLELNDSK